VQEVSFEYASNDILATSSQNIIPFNCCRVAVEEIKAIIVSALPGLTEEKITALLEHLESIGCETVDDLKLVNCETDLISVLRLLEVRKLAAKLKELGLSVGKKLINQLICHLNMTSVRYILTV
jgi:hypothetical protein